MVDARTRGSFYFLVIGRVAIVPMEKLGPKNKRCRCLGARDASFTTLLPGLDETWHNLVTRRRFL